MGMFRFPALWTAIWIAVAASTANAQDAGSASGNAIELTGSVGVVSDYRYRGVSLSDQEPAIQADVTATHSSGLYGYAWLSSIADNGGADIEGQLQLGYSNEVAGVQLDIGIAYYLYPEAKQDNYFELTSRMSRKFGAAELGVSVSYAPSQRNIGSTDNLYGSLDGKLQLGKSPLSLVGSVGIEDGAFGNAKRDWSLGLQASAGVLNFSVQYIDASRAAGDPNANAAAVASLSASF